MNPNLDSAKLSSEPTSALWTIIHEQKPPEGENGNRGHLYCLLVKKDQDFDFSKERGHQLLSELEQLYRSSNKPPFDSLVHAVKTVLKKYEADSCELTAAVFLPSKLHVVSLRGVFQVLRDGTQVTLIKNSNKIESLSGIYKTSDAFLIASTSFVESVPDGLLKSALISSSTQYVIEILAPYTRSTDSKADMAAVIVMEKKAELLPAKNPSFIDPTAKSLSPLVNLRAKLVFLIDKAIAFLPQKQISIRSNELSFKASRKKQFTAVLGFVLLGILSLSIVIGISRREDIEKKKAFDIRIGEVQKQLEEARSIKDLSRDKAKSLLFSARDTVAELKAQDEKDQKLLVLSESIDQSLGEIAGIYKVVANLYLDLSLVSSGLKADKVASSDERILILDKAGKKIVSVGLDTKKTEILAGPSELESAIDVAIYSDREFVLTDQGVFELTDKLKQTVIKEWDSALISLFAGNLYVLDKSESTIWRYPSAALGFGSRSQWLAEGVPAEFHDAKSIMIDGSIWILYDDGSLSKYSMGRRDTFSPSMSLGSVDAFFTSDTTSNLYFLDKGASKVLVFSKKGQFESEYEIDGAGDATDIVVSEAEKKLLLFTGTRILFVELKHL